MLYGIIGKKFSGKSTLAEYLVKNYNFKEESFASPLKDISKTLFCFTEDQVNGDKKEIVDPRWNLTPRKVLQFLGTEIVRDQFSKILPEVGKDFWIVHMKKRIEALKDKNIVVSDVRFLNELQYIKNSGGKIIGVFRELKSEDSHRSENDVDLTMADIVLNNTTTKDEFFKEIDSLFTSGSKST